MLAALQISSFTLEVSTMLRLPRFFSVVPAAAIVCAIALFCSRSTLMVSLSRAQEAPPPAVPATEAPANAPTSAPVVEPGAGNAAVAPEMQLDPALLKSVEDFWFYGKVARYDLAVQEANKIIAATAKPGEVLAAFEKVTKTGGRSDELYEWLLRWQTMPAMKDVCTKIIVVIKTGYHDHVTDPAFIRSQIERLSVNDRAYSAAMANLRQSGEIAVPFMVDYLRDGSKKLFHASIRRALVDMGRSALNPLVAVTETKNTDLAVTVAVILGDIGYPDSAAYIARLVSAKDAPGSVKNAGEQALAKLHMGEGKSLDPAVLFYDLAEKCYYGNCSITADNHNPVAYMWYWDEMKGLCKKDVPQAIFNDLMSMRSNEYSLKLSDGMSEAVSLWLAANFKREVDLGAGHEKDDPTRSEGQPNATYYGAEAGTQYLNKVLDRTLRDRNAAASLAALKALAQIAGQANLFSAEHQPIIEALGYPDRLVRYEAAMAMANGLPQKNFGGQEQVVPILADALGQTGKPNALVFADSQDQFNKYVDACKTAGYSAVGGTTPEVAIAAANLVASVDVIIVSETAKAADIERLFKLANASSRLERIVRFIVTASKASPFAVQALTNPMIYTAMQLDTAGLTAARQRSGALALDEKTASEYAMRAAALLNKLAISRGQVLDLLVAQPTLIASLDDQRPDLAKAAAAVLGLLNSPEAQRALAAKAVEDKLADDLKISMFKSLGVSAKFFGNQLEDGAVEAVRKIAEKHANLDVRSAAAEAVGSLNLPAEKAKVLITEQSKT